MSALHKTESPPAQDTGPPAGDAHGPAVGRAPDGDVDAAIARVLQAEQAARERVAACEREAVAIVQQAREQARRIAARAAQRTARVHARVATALAARLAEIEARRPPSPSGSAAFDEADGARIAAVAGQLARELTGGDR